MTSNDNDNPAISAAIARLGASIVYAMTSRAAEKGAAEIFADLGLPEPKTLTDIWRVQLAAYAALSPTEKKMHSNAISAIIKAARNPPGDS